MTNAELIQAIRAEIERRKTIQLKRIQEGDLVDAAPYDKNEAYNEILSFISTLESEKPMNQEELSNEISHISERYPEVSFAKLSRIAVHFAQWGAEHLADARKTSPKDLEEAAWKYAPDLPSYNIGGGYLPPQSRDDLRTAFKDGAKWQAEQMMKEAVEYEVWDFSSSLEAYPHVNIPLDNKRYRSGDKVRVIVLPKECEK